MASFKEKTLVISLVFSLVAPLTLAPAFAKSKSSRNVRAPLASRSLTAPRSVGRLGQTTLDNSPIYSSPGKKPIYSIIPRDTYLVLIGQHGDWYAVLMADGRYGWIAKSKVNLLNYEVKAGKSGNAEWDRGEKIVQDAFKYLGLPYVWGGYSTKGTDCSGFIKAVFAQNGIALPRVARDQAKLGADVKAADLRPGDRVYFSFKGQYIDHTGLYIGNGYFIHNSITNGRVAVDRLTANKWWSHIICFRR
jgi:cell wall-associated NlpC family hydrolase